MPEAAGLASVANLLRVVDRSHSAPENLAFHQPQNEGSVTSPDQLGTSTEIQLPREGFVAVSFLWKVRESVQ
jgi:hypothetical protein